MTVNQKKRDEHFMRRALSLALRGTGSVSPNPLVGCVVVRDGRILSEGYHRQCGAPHAERIALDSLDSAAGSTLYVNLEPCAHYGKTPPCAPSIVEKGVSRVVLGTVDPDVRVQGRGMEILRAGGVRVDAGVLEKECRWINRGFIRRITLKRPWVTLKAAVGLDGGMALRSGESKWITGYEARTVAHLLRAEHDAVLVGSGTVFRDDPELTVRNSPGRNPLKVVLDSRCSIPPGSRVLEGCLLFVGPDAHEGRCSEARSRGAEVVTAPYEGNTLSLRHVLTVLAERGVLSLLVEGGPTVLSSFLRHNLADALALFVSPKIMGMNIPFGGTLSFSSMDEAIRIRDCSVRAVGEDFLLEGIPACSPDL